MATQQDVIKQFMAVLDKTTSQGEDALDEAISACTNFSSYADFRAQLLSDCKAVGNATTFLKTYCGIDLSNTDTGAITGSDAGGTTKTSTSVVPESGSLSNFTGNSFTVNGLTVKLGNGDSEGNITSTRTFSDLDDNEAYLWQALYTWWMDGGLDLIADSYGSNYSFTSSSSAVTKTLWIVFSNLGSGTLALTWGGPGYAQKSTSDLRIYINTYYYGNVSGEDGNPGNGQKYLDRTMAHELTHAVMRANIDYFDYLPGFIKEGMAEITHGIDDVRTSAIKTLAGSSTKLAQALDLSVNTVTVSDVASASYAGGYIFLRYLAHQNADLTVNNTTSSTSVKTFAGDDTITNGANKVTVDAGEGDDSIVGGGKNNLYVWTGGNDTIDSFGTTDTLSISGSSFYRTVTGDDILFTADGGSVLLTGTANLSNVNVKGTETTDSTSDTVTVTDSTSSPVTVGSAVKVIDASSRTKAVKITGNSINNTITGGSGNDTLSGLAGNDLLTGGKGNDLFVYSAGKDTVTDYGTGNDKISVTADVEDFAAVGSNFVLGFGSGSSLTVTDAASKKISVVSGKVTSVFTDDGIFNTAGTAVTLNAATTEYTADTKVVTIDAGLTSNATVTGNSKANKVSFGDGENVFIWTKGNDTLENFGTDDLLSIKGSVSDGSVKSGNTYLKVGSSKITVEDSSQITFTDNDGTKVFSGGVFTDDAGSSATLTSATKDFDASDTSFSAVTGNAKANKLTSNSSGMTLTGGKGNDTFVNTGGNDYIVDYGTGSDKISLGSSLEGFSVSDTDVILDLVSGSVTIADGAGKKISLVSGGKTTSNVFVDGGVVNAAGTAVTLDASTKTFTATSKIVTIDADLTSNATITGNAKANKVTLGSGNNVFVWTKGNDIIDNFDDGDRLSITSATVTDGSVKGGNTYLKAGSGKITVKDATTVTFTDTDETKIFNAGIFYNRNETAATLGSAVNTYTATNVKAVTGNAKANKLYAGTSGTSLDGGKGNDSLWGGNGKDTFIFTAGSGTDKIFDFDDNDLLQILNTDGSDGSFTKAALSGSTLTLSVKGGGKVIFNDVTADSTFNINGDTYHVEGKTIVK